VVTLNGKTYTLGQDANLHVKDGTWSLLPSAGLKDGIYDVSVAATDADGVTKKDETVAEVEVDGVPPATPTVATYEGVKSPESITGTYDAKQATGLKVTVPAINVTAELGSKDSALTADGDGNWTMKLVTPLAPGKYDVNAESVDIRSRVQVDATAGEVVVTSPPPAPAGYDCVAVLNRVDAIFPIRFAFDHDDVQHPYDLTLQYYAAVLKDARCANVKVEVGGHADFHGSEKYNQGLSERRSQTIIDMLAKDGIDASRLVKKGYSKDKPLDPAKTDEARMKNRRVEITATSN
jgi:outer membrane protein OmpA-like peptidoglycan-associated protein